MDYAKKIINKEYMTPKEMSDMQNDIKKYNLHFYLGLGGVVFFTVIAAVVTAYVPPQYKKARVFGILLSTLCAHLSLAHAVFSKIAAILTTKLGEIASEFGDAFGSLVNSANSVTSVNSGAGVNSGGGGFGWYNSANTGPVAGVNP